MRILAILLSFLLFAITSQTIAGDVVQISPKHCKPDIHKQPKGNFALYVFCDDALGTNVAVYIRKLDAPITGKYDLGKRFWQGGKWGYDVTSYTWVNENYLLLATSYIYGTGAVYLLDLKAQKFKVVAPLKYGACITRLLSVNISVVKVAITDCESMEENIVEFTL